MTEDANTNTRTHRAWAVRREGKKFMRWLEVGTGRIDKERDEVHLFMDRLPIGGFTGYVMLAPISKTPQIPDPAPQRPDAASDDEQGSDD